MDASDGHAFDCKCCGEPSATKYCGHCLQWINTVFNHPKKAAMCVGLYNAIKSIEVKNDKPNRQKDQK